MSSSTILGSTIGDRPPDTSISDTLTDVALDLGWSFDHSASAANRFPGKKLERITSNPRFQQLLADLHRKKTLPEESEAWFQKTHPRSGVSTIAYFSMEFMLSEALPIYSGGLGNVAGDQLKAGHKPCNPPFSKGR